MLNSLTRPIPVGLPSFEAPSARRRPRPGFSKSGFTSKILNVVLYQAGWFGCVLAAADGRPILAAAAALVPVLIHIGLSLDRPREVSLVLLTGLIGLVVDTLTVQAGILRFSAPIGPAGMAPLWIVAMWMQFGMTFHFCFGWLSRRYVVSSILGAFGGPLSFLAGARLGAVEVLAPVASNILILGLLWAVAMPLMVALGDRLQPRMGSVGLYRIEQARGQVANAEEYHR